MTNGFENNSWENSICDDLSPILHFLEERHRLGVWKFSAGPQGRWARIYLRRNLSSKMMAELRNQFANSPQVTFGKDWCHCSIHDVSLLSPRSWWAERRMRSQRPLWLQAVFLVFLLLSAMLLVAGGVFVLTKGILNATWKDIGVGFASILLFGFSAYSSVADLVALARRANESH